MRLILNKVTSAWERRAVGLKAISFAMVGVVNTVIDLGVFLVAYNVLKIPLVFCNVAAWATAVTCSYTLNTYSTFGPESGYRWRLRGYLTFVVSGVAGFLTATAVLVFMAKLAFPILLAKGVSILVGFTVNFTLSHFVVFRNNDG